MAEGRSDGVAAWALDIHEVAVGTGNQSLQLVPSLLVLHLGVQKVGLHGLLLWLNGGGY